MGHTITLNTVMLNILKHETRSDNFMGPVYSTMELHFVMNKFAK